MEFCSSHVYVYSNSEDETISGDENDFDCERITYNENESYLRLYSSMNSSIKQQQQSSPNNTTTSSSEINITSSKNSSSIFNSSFIVHKNASSTIYNNDQVIECQYRFCMPKSIALSSINCTNKEK
jgi:hypothetical protein